jgi:hypothetical protein
MAAGVDMLLANATVQGQITPNAKCLFTPRRVEWMTALGQARRYCHVCYNLVGDRQ